MKADRYFYLHSPVGNTVPVAHLRSVREHDSMGFEALTEWNKRWYASGTMSLAAAVTIARRRCASEIPKVVLAAYGCPDLVSAILHAGAEPLFVDLRDGRLELNTEHLSRLIAERDDICAVIATDLFGISENWDELRRIVPKDQVLLIQDCAQSMQPRAIIPETLRGDVVAFSFGRGKPVCMLVGGLLLVPENLAALEADAVHESGPLTDKVSIFRLALYNYLIRPRAYALTALLMGDRLGQTRFKPLLAMSGLSKSDVARINAAVDYFWSHHEDEYEPIAEVIRSVAKRFPNQLVELHACNDPQDEARVRSRMPIMLRSPDLRRNLIQQLRMQGVTATSMYGRILPDIVAAALGKEVSVGDFPVARDTASRLMTLPVHRRLEGSNIRAIQKVLEGVLSHAAQNTGEGERP